MGVKPSSATERTHVFLFILFSPSLSASLFHWLYLPLALYPNVFVCFLSCIPSFCSPSPQPALLPLSTLSSSLAHSVHLHLHPLPSLSLPGRHTYTDNTAATCCFCNILQQASILHCSPLTQWPFLLWPHNENSSRSKQIACSLHLNQNSTVHFLGRREIHFTETPCNMQCIIFFYLHLLISAFHKTSMLIKATCPACFQFLLIPYVFSVKHSHCLWTYHPWFALSCLLPRSMTERDVLL